MRKSAPFLLIGLALSISAGAQDLAPYQREAEAVLQRLRHEMMQEMQTALRSGPIAAIDVCRHVAPEIQARIEAETGWELRRTALRVRDQENRATEQERSIMQSFQLRASAGQSVQLLRSLRVTTRDGQPMVHFMQAVPTLEGCIACHGSPLAPDVATAIAALYPDDAAIGYEVGDLRGAFSLYKPLEPSSDDLAAADPWDRIMTLPMPGAVTLDTQGRSGDPAVGRDLYRERCKSCHSASDLAAHVFGAGQADAVANLCTKLETHGTTDERGDCDIAAFLLTLSNADQQK